MFNCIKLIGRFLFLKYKKQPTFLKMMRNSPLVGLELDFPRDKSLPRKIRLLK